MGRVNREAYWWMLGFMLIVVTAFWHFDPRHPQMAAPAVLLSIPRLHDIGRSGWVALPVFILGIVLSNGLRDEFSPDHVATVVSLVETVVAAALLTVSFVALGTIPGQPGANRFGPPYLWRSGLLRRFGIR